MPFHVPNLVHWPRRSIAWFIKRKTIILIDINYTSSNAFTNVVRSWLESDPVTIGLSSGAFPNLPRHAQNPLSGERRKTLSIIHHALSPPPSHHHLYIIHLINWLQRFYRITMSLKSPFVPKSDVKQRFTTTTTFPNLLLTKRSRRFCPLLNAVTHRLYRMCGCFALSLLKEVFTNLAASTAVAE